MIDNNSLKKGIINQDEEDIKKIEKNYIYQVYLAGLFLCFKLSFFALMRYFIFYLEDFHKNDVPLNNLFILIFVVFYGLLQIFYGIIPDDINTPNLVIINIIGFTLELLIVINVEYNPVLLLTLLSLSLFFLLTSILTKIQGTFVLFTNLIILSTFAILVNIFFFFFFKTYFDTEKMGYLKYNIFIGGYVFAIWTLLYFSDFTKKQSIRFSKLSFEIGKDFITVISLILKEIKTEFILESTSTSSFNY